MSIDAPTPREVGKEEEYYDPQAYFQEVIDFESKRRGSEVARKPMPNYKRLSEGIRRILKERSKDPEDKSLDRFIVKRYPGQDKPESIATLRELILSTSNITDDAEIVVDMALDEEGKVIDPEIARAYLDSKKAEIGARIEEMKQKKGETEGKAEINEAELEQWDTVLELAGEHLANKTKAEVESGKAVMRRLIVLRNNAEKSVKEDKKSAKRREKIEEEIKSLEKEIERMERVKANL